jgi:hypothetical protein
LSLPGNTPRRSSRLRVLNARGELFEPKPGLPPGGRDECKSGERPCPYVRCKYHLWLVEGRDRPGRRYAEGVGQRPQTTLEPRWLEWPTPPCCALDVGDAVRRFDANNDSRGLRNALRLIQVAIGRDYDTLLRVVNDALAKKRADPELETMR